ncbi:MAG TPA: TetR/AcrR family transcriptional regulator [Stellaceae bacterium]|jgi:AcrR family transcriptional regulator|nr:TetR/AcrR family transcriptional regulator [Stellaceae bacterium]
MNLSPLELPGVNPARQKRSREMSEALLEAGQRLLLRHSLAELSVEQLCGSIGASVGAFYSRFQSKEAYFHALQLLACRRAGAWLAGEGAAERLAEAPLSEICRVIAAGSVAWMQAYEGVVRAALQHAGTHPARWTPFKELGQRTLLHWRPLLLRRLRRGSRRRQERAVGFAFQLLFGTLVNIVLNDPGPLSLADRELPDYLARAMAASLGQS